jgi:Protein of unknown function (DUF1778)
MQMFSCSCTLGAAIDEIIPVSYDARMKPKCIIDGRLKVFTVYPRAKTLELVERAAKQSGRSVSNFILLAAANAAAKILGT